MSTSERSANRTRFYQSQWKTDPTFYPTAKLAMEGPVERYAYVAALAPDQKSRSDALLVVDVDPASDSYGKVAGRIDLPDIGDELHQTLVGTRAVRLCVPMPHTLMSSGVISSSLDCDLPAFTLSTPGRIHESSKS
jgi:hypothetical protein